MERLELSSREYKLMLRREKFAGNEKTCRPKIAAFWKDTTDRLAGIAIMATRALDHVEAEKQRDLFFLDTEDRALYRRSDLVFRMRRKIGSTGDWDATLKFRHGDRLLAAEQTFHSSKPRKEKFEEDVKAMPPHDAPRFWALFSRSAEAGIDDEPATVGDCLKPFEDVGGMSLPPRDTGVSRVGRLGIREHVFEGGRIDLGGDIDAECALILWWAEGKVDEPIAAEFSFRFDLKKGQADIKPVRSAWKAMAELCRSPWVDLEGPTKTALVYGAD